MPFSENRIGDFRFMTSDAIGTAHAFTTRHGGVSRGIYASLNFGPNLGDDPENVRSNYNILGSALDINPDALVLSRQVHENTVRHVTKDDLQSPFSPVPFEADGLITAESDVPLVIFTADCVPILLFDPVARAVGAVHAGWRGTVRDIAGTAVKKMLHTFGCHPENIRAAIGPCISLCCYETGDDVKDAVVHLLASNASPFIARRGEKNMIDLKGINRLLLMHSGLSEDNIDVSPDCTSCQSDTYWSHRVTHGLRGSQVSVIMMKGLLN